MNQWLRRASDNEILTDEITNWTGWNLGGNVPYTTTVGGAIYQDPRGVDYEYQTITAYFAPHYPNSTHSGLRAIENAMRKKVNLEFRDLYGNVDVCRVLELGRDNISRWEDVPTKTIKIAQILLYKTAYHA